MDIKEYASRRQKLGNLMLNDSIAIVWSAAHKIKNGDTEYFYRQDSNFHYLTSFEFAESVCVITKNSSGKISTTLIIPDKDEDKEVWTGVRYTTEEVEKYYGVDLAVYAANLSEYIENCLLACNHIYFDYSSSNDHQIQIFKWIKRAQYKAKRYYLHPSINDLGLFLKQLRMIKSPVEIADMRKAGKISANAHAFLIASYKPGMSERDLEILFRKNCLENGLIEMAYPPIVAGGKNACTLHYNANNQALNPGELVLIDAGAEYNYYSSDITRTWPINGKFSSAQKIIYEIVLEAQFSGISKAIPGNTWEEVHLAVVNTLVAGLLECGLLKGDHEHNVMTESYRKYYMHGFGHWLGLDTHDQGILKDKINGKLEWQKLEPNMVLTMEPGLYISDKHSDIDPMWHNIGVRIEDDLLITSNGNDVITNDAPKLIEDIEQLYGQSV